MRRASSFRLLTILFHISRTLGPANLSRYFVTARGIIVVTRDESLFENPVTVDYFTSE